MQDETINEPWTEKNVRQGYVPPKARRMQEMDGRDAGSETSGAERRAELEERRGLVELPAGRGFSWDGWDGYTPVSGGQEVR